LTQKGKKAKKERERKRKRYWWRSCRRQRGRCPKQNRRETSEENGLAQIDLGKVACKGQIEAF